MKRSSLARRTPLQAKTRLSARTSGLRFRRRSAVETRENARVRDEVFARDGFRCRLAGVVGAGACFGGLSFHHIRKASQGGAYSVENGATLCCLHNDQLEADADLAALARKRGLVKRRGDR